MSSISLDSLCSDISTSNTNTWNNLISSVYSLSYAITTSYITVMLCMSSGTVLLSSLSPVLGSNTIMFTPACDHMPPIYIERLLFTAISGCIIWWLASTICSSRVLFVTPFSVLGTLYSSIPNWLQTCSEAFPTNIADRFTRMGSLLGKIYILDEPPIVLLHCDYYGYSSVRVELVYMI